MYNNRSKGVCQASVSLLIMPLKASLAVSSSRDMCILYLQ